MMTVLRVLAGTLQFSVCFWVAFWAWRRVFLHVRLRAWVLPPVEDGKP